MLSVMAWLAAGPAFAGTTPTPPLHFIGRYDFTWTGIPLAAAELSVDETKDRYNVRLAVFSQGLVKLFTNHRSDTNVSGRRDGSHYYPELYESHYWTKNKPRHIKIAYDRKGAITQELVEPPENRAERAEVPHALKDGTLDPLTLVRAVPLRMAKLRMFDAKHLYDVTAVQGEPVGIRLVDATHASIPYTLSRTPVAGMTQKELKDYARGEPPLPFYFSADERHIPLYINILIYMGSLRGELSKECRTWDECSIH